jgi:hypothetical protein
MAGQQSLVNNSKTKHLIPQNAAGSSNDNANNLRAEKTLETGFGDFYNNVTRFDRPQEDASKINIK